MTKQIKRKIYLLSKKPMKPIEVVQFETGVQLVFEVQDIELDETATATLFVRKPSGKFVFQEDNVSLTGNTVVIDLHNQAIAEYGKPFFQIKFKKGEEVISTFSGMLTVEKSLDDSGAEESKTVIAAFDEFTDEQIARIEEATRAQIDLMKAEVEAKGETVLATIPDEYTEMYNRVNTLFNSVASAIKGTVSGSVVRVDDVSPVEHSPVVKVHGTNLLPYGTLTFTKNKNCLLDKPIPAGTYTISVRITSSDTDGELSSVSINSGNEVLKYLSLRRNERVAATFTTTKPITNIDFCAAYNYSQGENDTATWADIQIEKGDTATEYTPYINPTTVTVARCGKNIIQSEKIASEQWKNAPSYESHGVKWSVSDDRKLTIQGETPADNYSVFDIATSDRFTSWLVNGVTYTVSLNKSGSGTVELISEIFDKNNGDVVSYIRDGMTFTVDKARYNYGTLRLQVNPSNSVNCTIMPQIETGSAVTDFEPYKEVTAHTPSAGGTVEGITSLAPTMTLLTDTEGVTIECEYNKDTGKVIEKLTNAVAALGGAV